MPALETGLNFYMKQKKGEAVTPLYPITKVANIFQDDGTSLVDLLGGKAPTNHGNHVPEVEAANDLKFLRCDNSWAEIQHATTEVFGTVKLSDSTTLDDSTLAATAKAVKAAFDKASHEHPYIETSKMGVANGVATLDSTGIVPASQLPSFVDDVVEGKYVSSTSFVTNEEEPKPITGEEGKIYVDVETNKTYRWSGTIFVAIPETIALGITSSTAFRGDYGNIAYEHSQAQHARVDATLTESSEQNGYIKINGTETLVYTHPGSGTNPHGTTKADVGLGKVENLTSDEILAKIDKTMIETAIGGPIATTAIATETQNGLMSMDHVKKLNACQRIYVQTAQPTEDCIWFQTIEG